MKQAQKGETPTETGIEYDDYDERHTKMSEMRTRVDSQKAGPSVPMPELQADPMGYTVQVGTIYILETEDRQFIKIGYTTRLSMRFEQHRRSLGKSGNDLRLIGFFPGTRHTESRLHQHFAGCRYRTEWYYSGPAMMKLQSLFDEPFKASLVEKQDQNPAAVALGRKGGKARLKSMTPEERREVARKAGQASAAARWGKKTA